MKERSHRAPPPPDRFAPLPARRAGRVGFNWFRLVTSSLELAENSWSFEMKWRGLTRFFLRWTLLPSAHRAPHARAPGLRRPPWPAGGRGACVVLRRIQVWNSCVWITSLCPLLPSPATLHCTRSYVCTVFLSGPIRPNIALAFAFAFKVEVFWEGLKIFKKFHLFLAFI